MWNGAMCVYSTLSCHKLEYTHIALNCLAGYMFRNKFGDWIKHFQIEISNRYVNLNVLKLK